MALNYYVISYKTQVRVGKGRVNVFWDDPNVRFIEIQPKYYLDEFIEYMRSQDILDVMWI